MSLTPTTTTDTTTTGTTITPSACVRSIRSSALRSIDSARSRFPPNIATGAPNDG